MPVQVRASFWFLICSFLQKGISTITTPIFTRLLSTEEYGQYSVFQSWLGIITIFVTMNMYSGVYTQGLIKFSDKRRIYASAFQRLTFVMVIVWTGIYLLFQNFWNRLFQLTTVQMLAMLLMIWTTAVFNFWAAEQRVEYRYRRLVTVTLLVSFLKPLVGIVFVIHAQDKVTARILGLALVELIGYTGLFFVQIKRGGRVLTVEFWKYAIMISVPLIPHYLSQTVLGNADRIMITNMVGNSEAGIYSLAYSLSQIMTLFNTSLMSTISPWIYQKIKERKTEDIAGTAYVALTLIAGVNLLLIAFAPETVAIFAPTSYYDAIWVIPPVAMSVFFMFCYDLFAKFEFYFEKTHYIMFASVCGAVLNIILNYFFIRKFGYYAAGYTTLLCYIVYALLHYAFMKKVCKEHLNGAKVYSAKVLIGMAVIFFALGFIFLFTYKIPVLRYLLVMVLLVTVIWKRKYIIRRIKSVMQARKIRQQK